MSRSTRISLHRDEQYVGPYKLEKTLGEGQTGIQSLLSNLKLLNTTCTSTVTSKLGNCCQLINIHVSNKLIIAL